MKLSIYIKKWLAQKHFIKRNTLVNEWLGTYEGKKFAFREHIMRTNFCCGCNRCAQYEYTGYGTEVYCPALHREVWY